MTFKEFIETVENNPHASTFLGLMVLPMVLVTVCVVVYMVCK